MMAAPMDDASSLRRAALSACAAWERLRSHLKELAQQEEGGDWQRFAAEVVGLRDTMHALAVSLAASLVELELDGLDGAAFGVASLQCGQQLALGERCPHAAIYRFTWPGSPPIPICASCAPRVNLIASALGFQVELEPIV